jgi:L-ascorbate metabolism protein UlaG (beta-lactamase superfamily)
MGSSSRRVTWLGHATVLIEAAGARLLTDPVLRDRIAHLKRHAPHPEVPADVDAVLISHMHHDHFDPPSLRPFLGAAAIVPEGAQLPGFEVHGVHAGDTVQVRDATVEAVQAWHDGRRHPGTKALDTLGYLVEGIWFAGDTELNPAMEDLRGRVDVALIPIWGWGPSLGPGHLDPAEAARAVELIAPRLAIPIHWGTFLPYGLGKRYARLLTEPPLEFAALVGSGTRVETIAPGGSLDL